MHGINNIILSITTLATATERSNTETVMVMVMAASVRYLYAGYRFDHPYLSHYLINLPLRTCICIFLVDVEDMLSRGVQWKHII